MTKINISGKNILIIGKPASGKTFLANKLAEENPSHHVIHTDDYQKYGYERALYVLLSELPTITKPTIIEGVLGYRLLRKGAQTGVYKPDIVVLLDIPDALMINTYKRERPGKDHTALKSFTRSLETILDGYRKIPNATPPLFLTLENSY